MTTETNTATLLDLLNAALLEADRIGSTLAAALITECIVDLRAKSK
jgi:hypothetical protein